MNTEVTETLFSDFKKNLRSSHDLANKDSWVSENGLFSNPSTTDQSMVLNNKSGDSDMRMDSNLIKLMDTQDNMNLKVTANFGVAARMSKACLIETPAKNIQLSLKNQNSTNSKLKNAPKTLLPKVFKNAFLENLHKQVNEEKLLTFSNSINQMQDSSVIINESIVNPQTPAEKKPSQRFSSCTKTIASNGSIKNKYKRGIQLPVTFTNLDDILKVRETGLCVKAKCLTSIKHHP